MDEDRRLAAAYETKTAALRNALIEGENSGPPAPFDFEAFLRRKHAETGSA